jgi:hypothetical protein
MFTFYLDDTEVREPESFTNIVFEKKREDKFFGFILRREASVFERTALGQVLGAGQIKFTEEKAVAILKAAKEKYGYGAVVKFSVYYEQHLAYDGVVNFWGSTEFPESFIVTFTDGAPSVKFLTNINKKYQIATNAFQTLSSTGIVGKTTHEILETLNIYKRKTQAAVNYSHAIPFEATEGSSKANVSPITDFDQILPLYTNDDEKKVVSVKGQIYFNVKTSNSGSFQIQLNDLIIQQYASDLTPNDEVCIIDRNITLQPNETITIKVVSLNDSSDTEFIYNTENTTLSIYEVKDNVKPTEVPVISSFDLMDALIKKASDNTLELESTFLKTLKHDWTNGKNLRGVNAVLNCTLMDVYGDMDKQYCLYTTVTDTKVVIERRRDVIKKGSKSVLYRDRLTAESKSPNVDFLFSSIKVGYKNWQGDAALSAQEVNATMEYQSNLFGRENVLDLECDSIAAGILIEEIRQLQFGKVSTEQQKKYDETLINLIPDDGADNYKNFGLNQDSRNLSIRPLAQLLNWAEVMGGYLSWDFTSGVGNYTALINNKPQNQSIKTFGNIVGAAFWSLDYNCELYEYKNIGDVIQWRDTLGNEHEGILWQAEWQVVSGGKVMFLEIMENETI